MRRAWRGAPNRLRLDWAFRTAAPPLLLVHGGVQWLADDVRVRSVVPAVLLLVLAVFAALHVRMWRREGGRFSRALLRGGNESYWTADGIADPPTPRERWGYRS
ncbi:hypothetical protein IQ251_12735 [Saccharopolyspora sp. HNM0983]|uniref:Uncharacterized protein n=2 Tax=Saccharopolyspora montiporae TaxID=2781240 RepID=A0A929BC48_9PSEU|nr:hypothetical protein [Saccharopolyspora sp. HNM0983]